MQSKKREQKILLKSLKEDGITEIMLAQPPQEERSFQPAAEDSKRGEVRQALKELKSKTLICRLCDELAATRKNVVFGDGNDRCRLMFVGEAPGADEDEQGLPFVGRAGKLLTQIIEAMGLRRSDVFIANTLKCRPPQNRPPQPEEVERCRPFLEKQIELIGPEIICALGTHAAQSLLKTLEPISRLRGKFLDYLGPVTPGAAIRVMCTYHPAYLLRNPKEKRTVWEDMKKIMKELDASAQK